MDNVSVIIPAFNAKAWIDQAIESCFEQGENYISEIIIVDDASQDGTYEYLKKKYDKEISTEKIIIDKNPKNKGANYSRDKGFKYAKGAFIQWLDADDILSPGKWESQIEKFRLQPNTDIVYGNWILKSKNGEENIKIENDSNDFLKKLLLDNWLPPHNYLLKYQAAKKLKKLNAWNNEIQIAQDRVYFLHAALTGMKFSYVNKIVCTYLMLNDQSISNMRFKERITKEQKGKTIIRSIIQNEINDKNKKTTYLKIVNGINIRDAYYCKSIKMINFYWPWQIDYELKHLRKIKFIIPGLWIILLINKFLK